MKLLRLTLPVLLLSFLVVLGFKAHLNSSGEMDFSSYSEKNRPQFLPLPNDFYLKSIQPVFNRRCVVCHSCAEAPCQLQLSSFAGFERGATSHGLLDFTLFKRDPTRLKDASSEDQWRKKGFFSVKDSLLMSFLTLGLKNSPDSFVVDNQLPPSEENACVSTPADFNKLVQEKKGMGMPFGLPALSYGEYQTISNWIAKGAQGPSLRAMEELSQSSDPQQIAEWEAFLNQNSIQSKLSARYIYEHTFSVNFHFVNTPYNELYQLVRSRTPFPQAVEEIVTERPYDSPRTANFYYRFKRVTEAVVQKMHIPWEVDSKSLSWLKELFLQDWGKNLNSFVIKYDSSNPFLNFAAIPEKIRYRFLLENSQIFFNGMTRGPVCTGRTATYAIRDHFWVFFISPEEDVTVTEPWLGLDQQPWTTRNWLVDHTGKNAYEKTMRKLKPKGFSVKDIWNGDGHNPNSALTVLRHDQSATVRRGLSGGIPETVWVMNYANFERLYYNLVADYIPWGSIEENLSTWKFMSRLRNEAEERFLTFLPEENRSELRNSWNEGIGRIGTFLPARRTSGRPADVQIDPNKPMESLVYQMIKQVPKELLGRDDLNRYDGTKAEVPAQTSTQIEIEQALSSLTALRKPYAQWVANISYLIISDKDKPWIYSLIPHRGYKFNNFITLEKLSRNKEKDVLSVFRGVVGDRPEIFFYLRAEDVREFVLALNQIKSLDQWINFKNRYGIRRNSSKFWPLLDYVHEWMRQNTPLESGLLDVRNYDVTDQE